MRLLFLNGNLSHLALQILMHDVTTINDDLSHLIDNLSPLALQIGLYSVIIICADLSHLVNYLSPLALKIYADLSHLALHIMLYSE